MNNDDELRSKKKISFNEVKYQFLAACCGNSKI